MISDSVYFYTDAVTPEGIFSLCKICSEDTSSTRTFLVRGSLNERFSFVENVCTSLEKEGIFSQKFLNVFDLQKLDGVYFPDIDVYLFSSDFPLTMPDVRQYTIDLGIAANKKELFLNKELIREAQEREKKYIKKSAKFLLTARSVMEDNARLAGDCVNAEKIERFVSRFVKREFGTASSFSGKEYFRFLTAVTPSGCSFPESTLTNMCPKLYCIDDKLGFTSSLLMSQLRESALICGFDVINMLSPLGRQKSAEHIFVPELGLGIITSNVIHAYKGDCFKRINALRFIDNEKIKKHKERIRFNLSAQKELISQSYHLMSEAKKSRDEYSQICSRSYDKEKIQSLEKETVKEILSYFSCT